MANVLVCIKRVPDSSSEVVLTEDAQSVDGRFAGFTMSPHEECAVELAVQVTAATGGETAVFTLGDAEAAEQLRSALAVGASAATLVEADGSTYGPADVAREVAAVVRAHESDGTSHDLVLLGNDAADSGDFQVGIRLAYELGRPVVNGAAWSPSRARRSWPGARARTASRPTGCRCPRSSRSGRAASSRATRACPAG